MLGPLAFLPVCATLTRPPMDAAVLALSPSLSPREPSPAALSSKLLRDGDIIREGGGSQAEAAQGSESPPPRCGNS